MIHNINSTDGLNCSLLAGCEKRQMLVKMLAYFAYNEMTIRFNHLIK